MDLTQKPKPDIKKCILEKYIFIFIIKYATYRLGGRTSQEISLKSDIIVNN